MNDTRQQILVQNFKAIHRNGYQGVRADKVVGEMGITKGALYHYFPSKQALGYAIVDELIGPMYINTWRPLEQAKGCPITQIVAILGEMCQEASRENISLGCPLNNLMQEMSPLDEGFRARFQFIVLSMRSSIEQALSRGQVEHTVSRAVNPSQVAIFILSALEGSYGVAKSLQSSEAFCQSIQQLVAYLNSLRAA
jgi:TetR/AcrR family transcriptional regulator, transcriptional repressor for nem operon